MHIMADIETLGTRPGCSVLSIGAVGFNRTALGDKFYSVISRKSCRDAGLFEDRGTLAWWKRQSEEAQELLAQSESIAAPSLNEVLENFSGYVKSFGGAVRVWGNGSCFDNAIIAHLYAITGRPLPWRYTNNRCYRTLKNLLTSVAAPPRAGVHHNALDDAIHQARHATECLNYLSNVYKREAYQQLQASVAA